MVEHFSEPILLHASLWHEISCFFFVPCGVMNLMKAALYMRGGEGRPGLLIRWRPAPSHPLVVVAHVGYTDVILTIDTQVVFAYHIKLSDKNTMSWGCFQRAHARFGFLPELHAQPTFGVHLFRTKLKGLLNKYFVNFFFPFYGS
jgi:hypothetical protein